MERSEAALWLALFTALAVVMEAVVPLGWKILPLAFIAYTSYRTGRSVGCGEAASRRIRAPR